MEPVKLWWTNSRNQKLFAWYLSPNVKPKALIILVHGHGEHSWRYLHWAKKFAYNGFAFMSWDHVGHGLSDGQRGHVRLFEHLLMEIDMALTRAKEYYPGIPVVLYGHSMGGNIVLNHTIRRCCNVKLLIATSPWIELTRPPAKYLSVLSSVLNIVFPVFPVKSPVQPSQISHVVEEVQKYATDPLNHGYITPRLYHSIRISGTYIQKNASRIKIPTLLMHGDADTVTSFRATRELAKSIAGCTFVPWMEMYHELHHETIRDLVFNRILDWIEKNLNK